VTHASVASGNGCPAAASFQVTRQQDGVPDVARAEGAGEGMDIGRDIRTYTIEPVVTPVPERAPAELPAEAPAEPVPVRS
jgi:hypothetical protein